MRALSVALALALAVITTDWVLTLTARRTPAEPVRPLALGDSVPRTQAADIAPVARLLGGSAPTEDGRIRLLGVIAQGARGKGIALMAVDGQAAMPVRAGETIAAGLTLTEVRADGVLLSRDGAPEDLRLPAKAAPAGIVKVPR
jgi:hypothetical protein